MIFLFLFISDLELCEHYCIVKHYLVIMNPYDIQTFHELYFIDVIFFISKLYMHLVGSPLILWEEKV